MAILALYSCNVCLCFCFDEYRAVICSNISLCICFDEFKGENSKVCVGAVVIGVLLTNFIFNSSSNCQNDIQHHIWKMPEI